MQKGMIIGIVAAVVLIIGIAAYSMMSGQPYVVPSQTVPSTESNTESAASANALVKEGLIEASIENFAFVPAEIRIKVGSKITWTNNDDSPHTVTSESGGKTELTSPMLDKGESYAHVFDTPGVYNYRCNLHPGIKGKVVVE